MPVRLSVNIDHVATVREARKTNEPDPLTAALIAQMSGADGITLHLRSDRRHINERDLQMIMLNVVIPVTLEMAATDEMVNIALANRPAVVTLVPERPEEVTTEGGLDVKANFDELKAQVDRLVQAKINVCVFVNPDLEQIGEAKRLGAVMAEINTGIWAEEKPDKKPWELERIKKAVDYTLQIGMIATAGHGLTYLTVPQLLTVGGIHELSIGHTIVSRAIFKGFESAIKKMKDIITSNS